MPQDAIAPTQDSFHETELISCEKRLYAAQLSSDVAELDTLLSEALLFVGPRGEIVTKQMDLDLHRCGSIRIDSFEPSEQLIRPDGDRGIVVTRIAMRGVMLGQPFDGELRYLRVWQKGQSGWQIIAGSVTQLP